MIWIGLVFGLLFGSIIGAVFSPAKDTIEFLNMAGTWFGAIATLSATLAAFYFQKKSSEADSENLKISNYHDFAYQDLISLEIVSTGTRPIKILEIFLQIDNDTIIEPFYQKAASSPLPALLSTYADSISVKYPKLRLFNDITSESHSPKSLKFIIRCSTKEYEHDVSSLISAIKNSTY